MKQPTEKQCLTADSDFIKYMKSNLADRRLIKAAAIAENDLERLMKISRPVLLGYN